MSFKEQLHQNIVHELKLCKRIFSLIPGGAYDFKPNDGMRSTLELLQYISFITSTTLETFNIEDIKKRRELYVNRSNESDEMKAEEFPVRIDREIKRADDFFAAINDKDLSEKEVSQSWPVKRKLGYAIIESALKWITAYKMQLFLYAKMSGNSDIDTGDCWFIT